MEVDNKREVTSEDERNADRIYAHCMREDSDSQIYVNEPADTELSQEILFEMIHSLVCYFIPFFFVFIIIYCLCLL